MLNKLITIIFLQTWLSLAYAESVIVIADVLNVRNQPRGKRITRILEGQQFQISKTQGGWGEIILKNGKTGWIHLDYVKPFITNDQSIPLQKFCNQINREFLRLGQKETQCLPDDWTATHYSVQGRPLLYTVLGKRGKVSLLLCSVHSDENTTYHCFRLRQWLKNRKSQITRRLVIMPLVNPDGYFHSPKTRQNGRGVDLNRNLPTSRWIQLSNKRWKQTGASKRRYPGKRCNSEPENQFLIHLIQKYRPDRIISLHSPLHFIDLDYSSKKNTVLKKAKSLAWIFSKSSHFKFLDYRTFPGSLGRYASEWGIPVYTVEFPSATSQKQQRYFQQIHQSMLDLLNSSL